MKFEMSQQVDFQEVLAKEEAKLDDEVRKQYKHD